MLTSSTVLKVKAFHPQCLPSKTVSARFIKLGKSLPIKNISINQTPHKNYPGTGAKGLVDRKKGTTNFRTSHWMGFAGGDLEAVIELEKEEQISKVTASLLSDPNSWIFMPQAMVVSGSIDGENYKLLNILAMPPTSEGTPNTLKFIAVDFPETSVKYIKVFLKHFKTIPDWHDGKGTPPWLFIDEILIE